MLERGLARLLQCGEYHADDPEEDDVVSCHQYICRIKILVLRCFLRPAKSRERPQGGGEPGIQRILILCQMGAATFRAFFRHSDIDNNLAALVAVVRRDTMSPPQLTGNTPVTDILKPVGIGLFKAFRYEVQIVCLYNL